MKFACAALPIVLLAFARPAAADVSEAVSYRYYTAPIEPQQTLYSSLLKASPIRENGQAYLGHTSWHVRWNLHWRSDAGGRCTLDRLHTHLQATITLPQRAPGDGRAEKAFETFSQALHEHELRHLAIARKAAQAIDERIWQLPTMPTCNALNQAANQMGERVLDEARSEGRAYDQRTGHGRSEGAVLAH